MGPDLAIYGKVAGGGLPIGVVAGRAEVMDLLAPAGDVFQAGTFSANPLAMAAGAAALGELTPEALGRLGRATERVASVLRRWLQDFDGGRLSHMGVVSDEAGMLWFLPGPPARRPRDLPSELDREFRRVFGTLLDRGVYWPPSPREVGFVSLAHDEAAAAELERRLFA